MSQPSERVLLTYRADQSTKGRARSNRSHRGLSQTRSRQRRRSNPGCTRCTPVLGHRQTSSDLPPCRSPPAFSIRWPDTPSSVRVRHESLGAVEKESRQDRRGSPFISSQPSRPAFGKTFQGGGTIGRAVTDCIQSEPRIGRSIGESGEGGGVSNGVGGARKGQGSGGTALLPMVCRWCCL